MKIVASALFLLLIGSNALAESVTETMARTMAERWTAENQAAFGKMGSAESISGEYDTDDTLLWWTVRMSNGGAVITAPDTGIEPVITILPELDGALPADDPLRALLTRDLKTRLAAIVNESTSVRARTLSAQGTTATQTARTQAVIEKSKAKWARLAATKSTRATRSTIRDGNPAFVAGLAKGFGANGVYTHWNQSGGIYNLHTPSNYVAGCVATAAAALLQYFNVTKAPDPQVTRTCRVDMVSNDVELTTLEGDYDWSILPTARGGSADDVGTLTADQKDLLSRVTYNMGVCVHMVYAANGSSAFNFLVPKTLRDDYGLSDGRTVLHPSADHFEKLIHAQNRCSVPVLLGISGTAGGHAVLAVGYGEDTTGTKYTRLFLGWGGARDAWYCLPEVDAYVDAYGNPTSSRFSVVNEIDTMFGTTDETMPLCGRVTDPNGGGVAAAVISIPAINRRVVTDANGFWGVRVNPNDFTVSGNRILCISSPAVTNETTFTVGACAAAKNRKETIGGWLDAAQTISEQYRGCYYNNPDQLAAAMPDAIDFVVEAPKTAAGVPHSWLWQFPELVERYGAVVTETTAERMANTVAANGKNTFGECYITGVNPTNATEKFEVSIAMGADGAPVLSWTPDLNEGGDKTLRTYTVEQLTFENGKLNVVKSDTGLAAGKPLPQPVWTPGATLYRVKVKLNDR